MLLALFLAFVAFQGASVRVGGAAWPFALPGALPCFLTRGKDGAVMDEGCNVSVVPADTGGHDGVLFSAPGAFMVLLPSGEVRVFGDGTGYSSSCGAGDGKCIVCPWWPSPGYPYGWEVP